ncbi:MAG TPA: hypothetical protein PLZ51_16895 [Aggregatilineales bacterium]|nr:hypothetical protein [Aggregatilineales bacterium]
MTFPEILEAIDTLSKDQLAQLKQKIQHREAEQVHSSDLSEFEALSNEALWAIVNDMPTETMRLDELRHMRESRSLTPDEEAEVSQLLQQHGQFILKRSQAIAVLHLRGIDVLGELAERYGVHP